jgi:hypothetical protein
MVWWRNNLKLEACLDSVCLLACLSVRPSVLLSVFERLQQTVCPSVLPLFLSLSYVFLSGYYRALQLSISMHVWFVFIILMKNFVFLQHV